MSKFVNKKIFDIVDVVPVTKKFSSALLLKKGKYPVYSAETLNNGIKGYTDNPSFNKNNETYIIFGDHTRSINVVNCPFSVMDNVKILKIKKGLQIDELYLKYVWQNLIPNLGYSRHWKVAQNIEISLPAIDNEIFDIVKQKEIASKYQEIEKQKKLLLSKIEYLNKTKIEIEEEKTTNYKYVKISDLFNPVGGNSNYTKEYCIKNKGNIPVYSGNTIGVFSYVNKADYNGKYLTWAKDGLAGFIMVHNGPFCITGHRGILVPKVDFNNIDLNYIKLILEPIFRASIKGRIGIKGKNEYTTLNPTMIRKITEKIKIPVNKNGVYDIEKQKEMAQKIATIESIKQDLYHKISSLVNIHIA